jgi:hypothetical protein
MNSIKQLKSVAMIYILPVPVKTLGMPAHPSGKFELFTKSFSYSCFFQEAIDNYFVSTSNIAHTFFSKNSKVLF